MTIVEVHLYSQSLPIVVEDVRNTYTKDGLYCIWMNTGKIYKFPVQHVFRIEETVEADRTPKK